MANFFAPLRPFKFFLTCFLRLALPPSSMLLNAMLVVQMWKIPQLRALNRKIFLERKYQEIFKGSKLHILELELGR